jgi:hypothetical protein
MKVKLIGLLVMVAVVMQAQVSYSVSPSHTVAFTALFDQLNGSTIYQLNTGSKKILLKWERLSVNLPAGWTGSICDNVSCFGDIPAGSIMDSVAPAEKGFLILDIDPGTVKGAGVVKMYVYQDGYYNMGDTLTWNITSSSVGIDDLSTTNAIIVYPNPAKDRIQIDLQNSGTGIDFGYILDAMGREVIRFPLLQQNNTIDISRLTRSCYNLVMGTHALQLIINNE